MRARRWHLRGMLSSWATEFNLLSRDDQHCKLLSVRGPSSYIGRFVHAGPTLTREKRASKRGLGERHRPRGFYIKQYFYTLDVHTYMVRVYVCDLAVRGSVVTPSGISRVPTLASVLRVVAILQNRSIS